MKKLLYIILIFVCAEVVSAATVKNSYLRLGSNSASVKMLQQILNDLDYVVDTSGPGSKGQETTYFGRATYDSVVEFQKAYGLKPDGIVGPKTAEMLDKVYESKFAKKLEKIDTDFKKTMESQGYKEQPDVQAQPDPSIPESSVSSFFEEEEPKTRGVVPSDQKAVEDMSDDELYKVIQKNYGLSNSDLNEFKEFTSLNCKGKGLSCYTNKIEEMQSRNDESRSSDTKESNSSDSESQYRNSEVDAAAAKILKNAYELKKLENLPGDMAGIKKELEDENKKLAEFIKKSEAPDQPEKSSVEEVDPNNPRLLFTSDDFRKYLEDRKEQGSEVAKVDDGKSILEGIKESIGKGIDAVKEKINEFARFFEDEKDNSDKIASRSLDSRIGEDLGNRVDQILNSPDYAKAYDDPKLVDAMSAYMKDSANAQLSNQQLAELRDGIVSTCDNSIETGCFDAVREGVLGEGNLNTEKDAAKIAEEYLKENNPEALDRINKEMEALEKSNLTAQELLQKARDINTDALRKAEEDISNQKASPEQSGKVDTETETEGVCECSNGEPKCKLDPKKIIQAKSKVDGSSYKIVAPFSETAHPGYEYVEYGKLQDAKQCEVRVEKLIKKDDKWVPAPNTKQFKIDPTKDQVETADIDFVPPRKCTGGGC